MDLDVQFKFASLKKNNYISEMLVGYAAGSAWEMNDSNKLPTL